MKMSPDIFVGVVQSSSFCCASKTLITRVAAYVEAHREQANGQLLSSLNSSKVMPQIDSKVALELLRFGLEYGVLDEDGLTDDEQPTAKKAKNSLIEEVKSSLRERSLASLHADFRTLQSPCLKDLPSGLVVDLFKGGLDSAISSLDAEIEELTSTKNCQRNRFR